MTEGGRVGVRARADRRLPRLHLVTSDGILSRPGWTSAAAEAIERGGADVAVHVRGRTTDGATLFALTTALLPVASRAGAMVVVNDRIDVAMTAGAHGAHLGHRSLSAPQARALLGPHAWIGVSTHGAEEVARAGREGADFAFVGTLHETPSHRGLPGMGVSGLREAIRASEGLPVLGIGGIDVDRVAGALGAGAHGVAVIRGVWDRPDAGTAVGAYLQAIEEHDR